MTRHDSREAIGIVLVEDNPADQEIARRVFGAHQVECTLRIASDGQKALDYLETHHADVPAVAGGRPDLILLDINMPRVSGMEVLARIRRSQSLRHIPVLILTTSALDADIREAYRLGCSSYILKPIDVPQFALLLEQLLHYWSQVATLPDRTNRGVYSPGAFRGELP